MCVRHGNSLLYTTSCIRFVLPCKAGLYDSTAVVRTIVQVKKCTFYLRLANIRDSDVWVTPRARITLLSKAKKLSTRTVNLSCSVQEINVQCNVTDSTNKQSEHLNRSKFLVEKRNIEKLFCDYSYVFSKSD